MQDSITQTEIVSALSGLLVPPIVELIKTQIAPNTRRWVIYLIALGFSIAMSVAVSLLAGQDITNITGILAAITVTQTFYNTIWKQMGWDEDLRKLIIGK